MGCTLAAAPRQVCIWNSTFSLSLPADVRTWSRHHDRDHASNLISVSNLGHPEKRIPPESTRIVTSYTLNIIIGFKPVVN